MQRYFAWLTALYITFGLVSNASASTVNASGVITNVGATGLAEVGDAWSAAIVFDENATDFNSSANVGLYSNAITSFALSIGGNIWSSSAGSIGINTDVNQWNPNINRLSHGLVGPTITGYTLAGINLALRDLDGVYFTTDGLPDTFPDPSVFETNLLSISYGFTSISGTISSISTDLGTVPVPPSFILSASALAMFLVGAGRTRRRKIADVQ